MSVLKKLQEVGESKPYYGFSSLNIGYHKILCFRVVKNKFAKKKNGESGKSILVELANEVIFLPQYFMEKLNEEDIAELNSTKTETMYLYFGGRRGKNK